MSSKNTKMQRFGSLRTLSLLHGIAFLALVAITGIVGLAALMLRHEASEEFQAGREAESGHRTYYSNVLCVMMLL